MQLTAAEYEAMRNLKRALKDRFQGDLEPALLAVEALPRIACHARTLRSCWREEALQQERERQYRAGRWQTPPPTSGPSAGSTRLPEAE
jgi:hypothetical protein